MEHIIIISIICISVIIITSIFCYTIYANNENSKSNKFFKTVNITSVQYATIVDELNNLKSLINSIQNGIEFISMQISNKENKDE